MYISLIFLYLLIGTVKINLPFREERVNEEYEKGVSFKLAQS